MITNDDLQRMVDRAQRGCGDNSCYFRKPKGMATNGGCRCFQPDKSIMKFLPIIAEQMAEMAKELQYFRGVTQHQDPCICGRNEGELCNPPFRRGLQPRLDEAYKALVMLKGWVKHEKARYEGDGDPGCNYSCRACMVEDGLRGCEP